VFARAKRVSPLERANAGGEDRGAENRVQDLGDERPPGSRKEGLKPHLSKHRNIPSNACPSLGSCVEDTFDVYRGLYDPCFPLVRMNESNNQVVGEVHDPITPAPGRGQIVEHEKVRNGNAGVFLDVKPMTGRRHVAITESQTRTDWAGFIKGMIEEHYPIA
jgi:hypothetical protein